METKSNVDWMKVIGDRCGFQESHIIPNDGSSGGLALFWILEIKIHVLSSSMSYIDGVVDAGGYFHNMAYDKVLWQFGDFKKGGIMATPYFSIWCVSLTLVNHWGF